MFRISKAKAGLSAANDPPTLIDQDTLGLLSQFCVVDRWSANLANAMLSIGETARTYHGLHPERDRFGLLELVRCYDAGAQEGIIRLFEHAASEGRPFHFSASLTRRGGECIVHCFGGHHAVENGHGGDELCGLFLFSRDLFQAI